MNPKHDPRLPAIAPQEALQEALGQFPGIVWTTDAQSIVTSAYGAGLTALGLKPNQTVGMSLAEYFHTDDPQFPVLDAHRRVMLGELRTMNMQWQGREFETRMQPLCDAGGAVTGCLGIAYDVTERNRSARVLPEYVSQMRAGIERAPDYVLHVDRSGTITYVESTRPDYQPSRVIGTRVGQWLRPETLAIVEQAMQRVFVDRQPQQIEIPASGSGLPDRWYDVRLRPVLEQERAVGLAAVAYDITERKHVELRLRESEQRFRLLTENLPGVVYLCRNDARYSMIYLNDAVAGLTGYSRQEFLADQVSFVELYHPEDAAAIKTEVDAALARHEPFRITYRLRHKDGEWRWIEEFGTGVYRDRELLMLEGFLRDVTDRKRSEQELQEAREELERRVLQRTDELTAANRMLRNEERMMRRLFDLRERERMMLAYDIHDGLVQDIVGAKMILEGRGGEVADGMQLDATSYQQVLHLLVQAIDEGRRMISELRPPILDEQGMIGSLEYLVAEQLQKSGCRIRFHHDVRFDRLSPLLEQAMFRIVQEALNNVARHSSAEEAEVNVSQSGQRIRIEIRDRGVGFDPAGVAADRFGLRGITERARLFGGTATIDSQPGKGTCIVVEVPINYDGPSE